MKKNKVASFIISGTILMGCVGTIGAQHIDNKELTLKIQELEQTVSNKEESVAELREEIETYREHVFSLNQNLEQAKIEYNAKVEELEKTKSQLEEVKSKFPSEIASRGFSRGTLGFKQVFNMEATAYYTGEPGVGSLTYTETIATVGRTVAVDKNLIPLGSRLYIDFPSVPQFNGYYIAEDIGGAIKGNIIDLYVDGHKTATTFGRRDCVIYVLE